MAMNALKNIFFLFFVTIFLVIISNLWIAQAFTPPSSYQPLEVIDGAALYKQQRTDGNEAYLQVIDLHKIQIDQLVGEVDDMGLGQGKYYKGEGRYYSPFFKMKLFEEVTDEYKELYGDHPARVLGKNQANRYQLIGTLDLDGIKGDELLLIMTVNRTTLGEGADLLRQLGVEGEIIT